MFKRLVDIIKSKTFLLVFAQLVIIFVSVVNRFPEGYICAGGDAAQMVNWQKVIHDMGYLWSNSAREGGFVSNYGYNLYNLLIYFISSLFNLSLSNQSVVYLLVFLTGSFWSFYFSLGYIFKDHSKIPVMIKVLFTLLYTFNIYSLQNFVGIWGFAAPFLFLYVLVPIMFSVSYRFFVDLNRNKLLGTISLLGIIFFISNISNGNLAFFIAQNILLVSMIILIYLFYHDKSKILTYIKFIALYYLLMILVTSWSVIPQVQEMVRISNTFATRSSLFDLKSWIMWQAADYPTVFYLSDVIHNMHNVRFLSFFSGAIFFALLILLAFKKKFQKKESIILILLIITMFLLNKGIGFLNTDVIWQIFKNPILGSLRSYDKAAIFIPFLLLIAIMMIYIRQNKILKYIIAIILFSSFLSVTPFVRGSIQKVYSVAHSENMDYKTSKYSSLVKIPKEYTETADKLNLEKIQNRIARIPYNVINSAGWVNFPKWKLLGVDVTTHLFDKPQMQMNAYGVHDYWNYGEFWNRQGVDESKWLLNFSGLMNSRYYIYQYDVDPVFIEQTEDKLNSFILDGSITEIDKNDFFGLYRIDDEFYLPHIYTPKVVTVSESLASDLPGLLKNSPAGNQQALYLTKNNAELADGLTNIPKGELSNPTIEYKEINPTKYRVKIHNAKDKFPMVFSEAFNSGWKMYPKVPSEDKFSENIGNYAVEEADVLDQASKEEVETYIEKGIVTVTSSGDFISKNFKDTIQNDNLSDGSVFETLFKGPVSDSNNLLVNGYANSWLIDPVSYCSTHECIENADGSYDMEVVLEFWPQRLYYIFGFITLLTFVLCAATFILSRIKKRNHNGKL